MRPSDEAPGAPAAIRFGTSGWRGILGDDFTLSGVRLVVAAVAERVAATRPGARVVVGHDRRFLGPRLAETAARVLAGAGLRPVRARGAVPTPVLAHGVRRLRAAAGIMFTASHNPPDYQGLKLFGPAGAGAEMDETRALEQRIAALREEAAPEEAPPRGRPVDLVAPYLGALLGALDRRALRSARLAVTYDAMHGAGAGVLDVALERAGVRVVRLRHGWDPGFGGEAPDPLPARLAALRRAVRAGRGLRMGLATDGDGDRLAVVDADGSVLSETETVALLVDHLARTGRIRRGVAVSCATGGLVERVARAHGLSVSHHPMGFKYLSRALLDGLADVAGEESGGFAWAPLARDKDGILAGCLLAERIARDGTTLRRALRGLTRAVGSSSSGRSSVAAEARTREALARLIASPPERVDGARVRAVDMADGLRLALDDGFLMWRASGTEPLLRVYADAPSPERLARRLRAGAALLRRASRR